MSRPTSVVVSHQDSDRLTNPQPASASSCKMLWARLQRSRSATAPRRSATWESRLADKRKAYPCRRRPGKRRLARCPKELRTLHVRGDTRFDHRLSPLRPSGERNDADERLPICLRMPWLLGADKTQAWRLLRVLFVWRCALPPGARSAGQWLTSVRLLLYRVSESVTLGCFPNQRRNDSTWRTKEVRHAHPASG